jgi:hypothetical protein
MNTADQPSISSSVNPKGRLGSGAMDSATLAVVGTLCGVLVTATAALLGNLLTARHQRASTERQLLHTVHERLRTERREAFVDYFAAYSALREKIDIHAKAHAWGTNGVTAPQLPSVATTGRRGATGVEEYAARETAQFYRCYQVLRLIAGDAVGEAAKHCTDDLWGLAGCARSGDQSSYDEVRARAQRSRRALRQAMREELGVAAW